MKEVYERLLKCGERIEPTVAACWGPMLVARSLWREFGLESILDGLAPKTSHVPKAGRLPLADRVLVLVANRLCRPGSEHALAQWLESDFVCGRDGERILARWQRQGRVPGSILTGSKIGIARWTSCSRAKNGSKWNSLAGCTTFHLEVEMVFYDLTSTYFEGRGPAGLADFGYSREVSELALRFLRDFVGALFEGALRKSARRSASFKRRDWSGAGKQEVTRVARSGLKSRSTTARARRGF